MTFMRCVRAGCHREEEQKEELRVTKRVAGTHSTADGCTGLVALDPVNFTG